MRERTRVLRGFVLVLSVFSLVASYGSTPGEAWGGVQGAHAQERISVRYYPEQDGEAGGGGACSNTVCVGVNSCRYQAYYQCSMTSSSCTNRHC